MQLFEYLIGGGSGALVAAGIMWWRQQRVEKDVHELEARVHALEKKPTDIVLAKVETTLEFLLQALQRLENKIEPPKN
ncbi:MAG: hypothetical protein ACK52I_23345 [Pseudomonadota bacterium]|jgi:phage shock protein A